MITHKSKCYNKSLSLPLNLGNTPIISVTNKYHYDYIHFYNYFNKLKLYKNSDLVLTFLNRPKELKLFMLTFLV